MKKKVVYVWMIIFLMSLNSIQYSMSPPRTGIESIISPEEKIETSTLTIQEVIDTIMKQIPAAPIIGSVDTFKCGDPSQKVTAIVTTFLATCEVIQKAIDLGANLIITHEPTFYDHGDEEYWLKGDSVFEYKKRLIDEHNIVIWRFHDYWHLHQPDGIVTGLAKELGWEAYADPERKFFYTIPTMTLSSLIDFLKKRLDIPKIRVMGDPEMTCDSVALSVGYGIGRTEMRFLRQGADVVLCGEEREWETCEYVRDAIYSGQDKALIILGHAKSEEPGMKWLVEWLNPLIPGVKVTHVPAEDPFRIE